MSKEKFDVVLLSGGGIKGVGELGVLHYYYESGLLDFNHVKEFVGTSIGSVINLLIVCGYKPMEIFTKVYTMVKLFDPSNASNIWDMFVNYGIMSMDPLISIVAEMVIQKLGKLPTLLELYKITGKLLTITAVNVSKTRVEYFNYETKPNLGVIDAAKISCNLPLIFHKIKYHGDYWVDGGLVDSFPYGAIKNTTSKILGILVTGTDKGERPDTFINYLYQLLIIPMNPLTQLGTKNMASNVKLITMVFDNISILNFAMENSKKMEMFMKGYHTAQREEEKKIITVKGWEWDVEQKTDEHAVLDFWSDSSVRVKDGWDWEEIFDRDDL